MHSRRCQSEDSRQLSNCVEQENFGGHELRGKFHFLHIQVRPADEGNPLLSQEVSDFLESVWVTGSEEQQGLGMTTVVEASGKLAGIITDGDLRRLMQQRRGETLELTAAEAMTKNPATIEADALAGAALNLMEQRKITSIVVVDGERHVVGVVHLHDLWTLQLF